MSCPTAERDDQAQGQRKAIVIACEAFPGTLLQDF